MSKHNPSPINKAGRIVHDIASGAYTIRGADGDVIWVPCTRATPPKHTWAQIDKAKRELEYLSHMIAGAVKVVVDVDLSNTFSTGNASQWLHMPYDTMWFDYTLPGGIEYSILLWEEDPLQVSELVNDDFKADRLFVAQYFHYRDTPAEYRRSIGRRQTLDWIMGPAGYGIALDGFKLRRSIMDVAYVNLPSGNPDMQNELSDSIFNDAMHVLFYMNAVSNIALMPVAPANKVPKHARHYPKFQYKVLGLRPPRSGIILPSLDTQLRASPRQHLRRGHIRRLGVGRFTWVSPCVVGNPEIGTIVKDHAASL